MSFASRREDLAGIALGLPTVPHPESPALLQDVRLMSEAALSQHPEVHGPTRGSLQIVHDSRLLTPGQRGLRAVEDGDVEVAVRAEQSVERAAIEEYGQDIGRPRPQHVGADRRQTLDSLGDRFFPGKHVLDYKRLRS